MPPSKPTNTPSSGTNAKTQTNSSTNPPKRPAYTLLSFLHDNHAPFGDSTQGGLSSGHKKEENMKVYLEKWDKQWKEMKKE
ncbi:hypothetical protein GJ744_007341 [Endocarpon pusillum]|uniref:Uncharacterized protein n=1 Tax=Endocarpon pusillum TaxID=364733 RepID=A0A8H7E638_9EURO|nr:hypothetical protein GJ744_007341 [Endocarpon pusillum]